MNLVSLSTHHVQSSPPTIPILTSHDERSSELKHVIGGERSCQSSSILRNIVSMIYTAALMTYRCPTRGLNEGRALPKSYCHKICIYDFANGAWTTLGSRNLSAGVATHELDYRSFRPSQTLILNHTKILPIAHKIHFAVTNTAHALVLSLPLNIWQRQYGVSPW